MIRALAFTALLVVAPLACAAPTRVLIVGNSLTYTNNLPAAIAALAAAQPDPAGLVVDPHSRRRTSRNSSRA